MTSQKWSIVFITFYMAAPLLHVAMRLLSFVSLLPYMDTSTNGDEGLQNYLVPTLAGTYG